MIFAREIGSALSDTETKLVAELAEERIALEVGSWYGRSSVAIASTAEVLHCIDWHRGEAAASKDQFFGGLDSLPAWRDNMLKYNLLDKTVMHMGTTAQVCPFMRSIMFDFVFIDGDHTYEGVCQDINEVRSLLKPKGIWMFHDYTWEDLGVAQACDELLGKPDRVVDSSAIYGG